ncbi:MAG: DsrE family protein [Firmicutes bacterium]|nr:DsrE family protein [Bacillota bacterium]
MNDDKHLYILWATGDPVTSEHMVLMYSTNAMLYGWWDKVTVIIWGAAQKLAAEDEAVRLKMDIAKKAGVEFTACVSCAVNLGLKEKLENDDIEVIRWGEKLSKLMQEGKHIITV